jgi:hypothetical protein
MPANLVPKEAIPDLALQVNTPVMLKALKLLQHRGYIQNSEEIDAEMATALKRLTTLGLADAGYAGPTDGEPFVWVGNSNSSRVLHHLEATQTAPYKVEVHPRAYTALSSLSSNEREAVLAATEALRAYEPSSWPHTEVSSLGGDKPVYVLHVTPDLRAFIVVPEARVIELYDIVRQDTLEQFLARERTRSKVG